MLECKSIPKIEGKAVTDKTLDNPAAPLDEQFGSASALPAAISEQLKLEKLILQRTEELEAANKELRAEALLRKRMEAKVLRLSLTDELTGLSNRRGFLIKAEQLLKLLRRIRTHACLIYIGLDGLKPVNDRFGREAGDHLIRSAARVLRESFRDSDILSRIGGDEFVIFATGSAKPVDEIQQRLDQNIAHHNFCFPNHPPLAMSVGVLRCDPYGSITLEDMIHQADAAMYIEKRRKRAVQDDDYPKSLAE